MWIIKPDITKANAYIKLFWKHNPGFYKQDGHKARMTSMHRTYVYKTITKPLFEKFLISTPLELLKLHTELYKAIYDGTHDVKEEEKALKFIFSYSCIVDNTNFSYELADLMGVNTCIYCNRQYTLTINNQNEHIIRPQFDHWFPQYQYLDLALSYFNLIPSCSLCNTSLKHDKRMNLKKYIHPYVDKEEGFLFDFHSIGKDASGVEHFQVDCLIDDTYSQHNKRRVKNTLEMFRIEEIYSAHESLELRDLVELSRAYPNDYIENLIQKILGDTGLREEDAYRLLFGIETLKDNYKKRPFSKFKTDIIKKLKEQMK
ncbi:MAG: hypothetical protein J6S11_06870 [Bacteroidaceae bacterium]|nr:hypothetical protein [Bacteroidaceae bacterium]